MGCTVGVCPLMITDDCKYNFATSPKSHAQGATKYDNAKVQDQCKSRCLAEAECKAVDWK